MAVNKEISTHSEQAVVSRTAAAGGRYTGGLVFSQNTQDSHHAHCRGNVAKRSNSLSGK